MDDFDNEQSHENTEYIVGPFGRLLPIETVRPEWLRDFHCLQEPTPRRYARSEPVEKPTALRFGSDTSLLGPSQQHDSTTPNPPRSMARSEPDEYRSSEFRQLPTPTAQYPASMSTCSTRSSTASPVAPHYPRRRRFSDETAEKWYPRPNLCVTSPDDATNFSLDMYMASLPSAYNSFSPVDFDLTELETPKLDLFPTEDFDKYSTRYHQSRLPFIPDLAPTSAPNPETSAGKSPFNLSQNTSPIQKLLAYVVEERVIEGEGLCYIYSDGSHCPKYLNGELVNANWGITKAGKPRKRLAQACLTCRARKIKCLPNFPKCDQCQRSGRSCRYENA